jgi:hypothetical protein
VDLYTFAATQTSRWGTRPEFEGRGFSALDLMDVISARDDVQRVAITDATGNAVAIPQIIAAARAEATTPEAQQHWIFHMAHAVVEQLGLGAAAWWRGITDDDWLHAGRWWAENVAAAPESALLDAVRERLPLNDPTQLEHGLRQFTNAANTPHPRFRGDLGSFIPTAEPRVSRLRGTAAAELPGTRPTVGGAAAGRAGPGADPFGRTRH